LRTPPTTDAREAAGSAAPAEAPERRGGIDHPRPRGPLSLLVISNWRVRRRAIALIAIPTVAATVFGGMRVYSSVRSAQDLHQVEQLAVLGGQVTALAQALEDERDATAGYAASGRPASGLSAVRGQQATTDRLAASVRRLAGQVGSGYPSTTQVKAEAVATRIANLPYLRSLASQGATQPLTIITDYSQAVADLFSLDDEIAQGSGNSQLVDTVRTLGSLSRMKDQASQQRAILDSELIGGGFVPDGQEALDASEAQQASELAAFQTSATLAQNQSFTDTVAGAQVDQAQDMEQRAIVLGNSGKSLDLGMPGNAAAQQWYPAMSETIDRMRTVERQMVDSIIAQSAGLQRSTVRSAVITGAVVLVVLLLVLFVTIAVARSMVRPLRTLRAGALEVADRRLPEAVRRLDQSDGGSGPPEIEPVGVSSTDEIGEVARAFDQVHREALRLAAGEALLRGSVNGMFVNLSRRTQSLVERQLRLIDRLEQSEQDPERLGSLFQMDHLATRMRRNSENLLVLAGHDETARRWTEPAPVVDVLRAAVSEIEQYERVTMDVQPGLALRGQAVSDAVHLLAEIIENATTFSAADTRVNVSGRSLTSGGFLLEITDSGVGMTADELAHENWRLDNPPTVDISVSRRMGLFVVGRLAAKHNIRVRLRPSEAGGLTALVWIPDSLIVARSDEPGTWRRRVAIGASTPADTVAGEPVPVADSQMALSGEALALQSLTRRALPQRQPGRVKAEAPGEPDRGTAPAAWQPTAAGTGAASGPQPAVTPPGGSQPDGTPGAGFPPPATPAGGFPPPVTPAAGFPSPAAAGSPPGTLAGGTPAAGTPAEGMPPAGAPAGGTPAGGFPAVRTPAGGFPSPATPARGFGSAASSGSGLPSRVPGAGLSRHAGRDGDRPGAPEAAAGPAPGPYTAPPVVVPPAAPSRADQRLPIFDSIDSEWFRNRGQHIQQPLQPAARDAAGAGQGPASPGAGTWTSPADKGFSAAQAAAEPAVGDVTAAGLPRRVPQANSVPGSVTGQPRASAPPVRSPETARSRLESFQEGVRQARAAIATEERPDE
jgi:signal transduction histidine kinase